MPPVALPSLSQLFSDAWKLTTNRFWSVLLLWLVQGLIAVVILAITLFIFVGSSFTALINDENVAELTALSQQNASDQAVITALMNSFGPILIVSLLVFVGILVVLGPLLQGTTLALIGSEEKISIGAAFRIAWKKYFVLIGAGFIMSLLVFGSFFLFLIPGLVVAIFFTFALYEVVLNDASAVQSLKTSAGMVKRHFWQVTGRSLMLMLLAIGVSMIGEGLAAEGQPILSLVNSVITVVFNVFSMMYVVALYRGLKTAAPAASMSLTPIIVISVLGWLGAGLFISNFLQTV